MAEKNSLWKNIRNKAAQNKRTGATPKKPTTEMIRQERKIKAKKAEGGYLYSDDELLAEGGYYPTQGPGKALFKGYDEGGYMYSDGGSKSPVKDLTYIPPTRQDSLDVFNNAIAVRAHYDAMVKKNLYKKPEIINEVDSGKTIYNRYKKGTKFNDELKKAIKDIKDDPTYIPQYKKYHNIDKSKVLNLIKEANENANYDDPYKVKIYDLYPSKVDIAAPATIIDNRISPQAEIKYNISDRIYNSTYANDLPGGTFTGIPMYDPIAVSPFDMLNDEQKAERVKKYGPTGVPTSYTNPINILESKKLTSLPTEDIKLNLKEPFSPSKVLLREMGNVSRYNNNQPYKKTREMYMDDGNQWRPISDEEYEMYKKQYPGADTTKGWIQNNQKAEGGYMYPDGGKKKTYTNPTEFQRANRAYEDSLSLASSNVQFPTQFFNRLGNLRDQQLFYMNHVINNPNNPMGVEVNGRYTNTLNSRIRPTSFQWTINSGHSYPMTRAVYPHPKVKPVFEKPKTEINKLDPLKLTNIPTEEIPLTLKSPPKQKAYINRGVNSGLDANGNPLVSEVNLGNGKGWQQVPYNTLDQYEEIKAEGGYTNPYNMYQKDPYLQYAQGGYMYKDGGPGKKPKPTYLTPEQLGAVQVMQPNITNIARVKGEEVGSYPSTAMTYNDNRSFYNSHAVIPGRYTENNPEYNDLVKRLVYEGKVAYDPTTGIMHRLKEKIDIPEGRAEMATEAYAKKPIDERLRTNKAARKDLVMSQMVEIGNNPLFYAPGAIAATPFIAPAAATVGAAMSAPMSIGSVALPITGVDALGLGFGMKGASQLTNDLSSGYYKSNAPTADKIVRGIETGLDIGFSPGVIQGIGAGFKTGRNLFNLRNNSLSKFVEPPVNPSVNSVDNQLPPPPSEIQILPNGTTRTVYNQQPITTPPITTPPSTNTNYDFALLQDDYTRMFLGQDPIHYPNLATRDANEAQQIILRNTPGFRQPLVPSTANYSPYTPPPIPGTNKSGLTRDQVLNNPITKDRDIVSKMTDQEFAETVLKPNGEVVPYQYNVKASGVIPISKQEWANEFNTYLDDLNDNFINDPVNGFNKSGIRYKIENIDDSGNITIYTPKQTLADGTVVDEGRNILAFDIEPGLWRGTVEDIPSDTYHESIPGLRAFNTSGGIFPPTSGLSGTPKTGLYDAINAYIKKYDLGRLKDGASGQSRTKIDPITGKVKVGSFDAWNSKVVKNTAVGFYADRGRQVSAVMRTLFPYAGIGGAGALYQLEQNSKPKQQAAGGYTIKNNNQSWRNYFQYATGGPYNQYANGGYMYGNGGRTWKNIGAGAFGLLEGVVDTTFGWIPGVDMATDLAYKGLQKLGKSTDDEKREQDSIAGYAQTAGAVGSAILTGGATTGTAIAEGAQGLGKGISKGNETSEVARGIGTGLGIAGGIVGAAYGSTKGAKEAKSAFKLSEAGSQGIGKFAASAPISGFSAAPKGTMQGVIDGNAVSIKPGTDAALSSVTPTASIGTFSSPDITNINAPNPVNKIADVTSAISDVPKLQEPPPMAPPVAVPQVPPPTPQVDYNQFQINPPAFNTGVETPDFNYKPSFPTYSQGGNITNNSLNLRNTMRYKRFAQGGTFDQYGINMIPESAGLHHQSAYGGVPIGPDALAEGGEIKMDTGDGGQYIVSDQVDGAGTQKDFTFSKGGKYKELNRTLADGMKQDLSKYTMGNLATNSKDKENLRRPFVDTYAQSTIEQIKQKWQQKTEYARKRSQQEQVIAQAEEQKRMAEEQFIGAYGGKVSRKNYPNLNRAKGGYVHNQMTQPMLAQGGPLYGDPASPYTYAYGGMYGDPYARGGQIDYTNDMYSSYAGGGPMVGNAPQAFKGYAAQNRGGMLMNYADGGMMPSPEQQMMQEQQMQQAPQEQMPQQGGQEQMMQMVQQVIQALMQGANPEEIMQQLVQSGIPPEQAQQIIQVAMQEAQSQQQQQPMQGEQQMMPQQGMAQGGMMPQQEGVATQIAEQLQQGADPQQILESLVQKGMPQQQAMAMLKAIMGQLKNQMQQQPQQQMMPQEQMAPQQGAVDNGMMQQYGGGGKHLWNMITNPTYKTTYRNIMQANGYPSNRQLRQRDQFNAEEYARRGVQNTQDEGAVFSPLSDESTMSQIAGLGQAVVPAIASAYAFNNLSKRKLNPSLVENVKVDYSPERVALREEGRRGISMALDTMKRNAPTSASFMGNAGLAVLKGNKLVGSQISKSLQDEKNKQADYDYNTGTTNAGIRNKVNETNEETYQNAMQSGFQAAGQGVKNVASYYGDLENRKLQRWQAMNTSGEDWHWTPKGKAFRNKEGVWHINGVPVDASTGNPLPI